MTEEEMVAGCVESMADAAFKAMSAIGVSRYRDMGTPGSVAEAIRSTWGARILAIRAFIRNATMTFEKPRVLKKGGAIKVGGMSVTFEGVLSSPTSPSPVMVTYAHDLNFATSIPYAFLKVFGHFDAPGWNHEAQQASTGGLHKAVAAGLEGKLSELQSSLASEYQAAQRAAPEIVERFLGRRGGALRKDFRQKLAKAVRSCDSLMDEDPAFILKVMQMDSSDLDLLAKFAKRNASDLMIVTEEDVKQSLDEAQVSHTLSS